MHYLVSHVNAIIQLETFRSVLSRVIKKRRSIIHKGYISTYINTIHIAVPLLNHIVINRQILWVIDVRLWMCHLVQIEEY